MKRCNKKDCLRAAIPDGAMCDQHTREAMTDAFAPEWVIRARERRLPSRVEYA